MQRFKGSYLDFLRTSFAACGSKDSDFSLRAFARLLDTDPGEISRVLSGKRHPTLESAHHIAQKLNLSQEEIKAFVESVLIERNRKSLERIFRNDTYVNSFSSRDEAGD